MPAFKILGVSWAVYRVLTDRLGAMPTWRELEDLRRSFGSLRPLTLATATTGNHGRAVARVAAFFDLEATIFVPRLAPRDRVAAIVEEGAEVVECDGGYDEAVDRATSWARSRPTDAILLSDTAQTEEDHVSVWISEGYSTLFWETEDQLSAAGEPPPDTVVVQVGAGSLALTAATHFRRKDLASSPTLIGVEASSAACFQESARAGDLRRAPGPHESRMFCLNVGVPSRSALNPILKSFDAFVAIDDTGLGAATRALAKTGVVSGPTGAAGLVGLREALPRLGNGRCKRVLLVNTEGAADPSGYANALLE